MGSPEFAADFALGSVEPQQPRLPVLGWLVAAAVGAEQLVAVGRLVVALVAVPAAAGQLVVAGAVAELAAAVLVGLAAAVVGVLVAVQPAVPPLFGHFGSASAEDSSVLAVPAPRHVLQHSSAA